MDQYTDKIHTCTYPLHVLDTTSCLVNIPAIFYFKGEISTDVLRDSFYKTVCYDFPILVGRLHMDGKGYAQVDVDKDNLNIPDYQESSSNKHFDDLKSANFGWDAMPKNLVTVPFTPTAGKDGVIKLVNLHVVQLKDGSGIALFINVPHFVMDGWGYFQFMLRWSQVFNNTTKDSAGIGFSFDRLLLEETIEPIAARSVDSVTSAPFTYHNFLSRCLAWVSPVTRGRVAKIASCFNMVVSHVFSIPTDILKNQQGLSDNDMLTALVSVVLSQCFDCPDKKCTVIMAVDIRFRVGSNVLVDERYMGNCLGGRAIEFASSNNSIIKMAQKVRATVNDTDPPFVAGFIDMLKDDPLCFTSLIAYSLKHPNTFLISNQSRFPLHECSFGGSTPKWITPSRMGMKTIVCVLPKRNNDEYNIYMGSSRSVMKRVLDHPLWQEYTNLVY